MTALLCSRGCNAPLARLYARTLERRLREREREPRNMDLEPRMRTPNPNAEYRNLGLQLYKVQGLSLTVQG